RKTGAHPHRKTRKGRAPDNTFPTRAKPPHQNTPTSDTPCRGRRPRSNTYHPPTPGPQQHGDQHQGHNPTHQGQHLVTRGGHHHTRRPIPTSSDLEKASRTHIGFGHGDGRPEVHGTPAR